MAYTLIDLIDKMTLIEQQACKMYRNMMFLSGDVSKVKTVIGVLEKEEVRHVSNYVALKEELLVLDVSAIELDFGIYDKASEILGEFKRSLVSPEAHDVKEILRFAFEFEQRNLALLVALQDCLVKNQADAASKTEEVLTRLIAEEQKHVSNLKPFVKE